MPDDAPVTRATCDMMPPSATPPIELLDGVPAGLDAATPEMGSDCLAKQGEGARHSTLPCSGTSAWPILLIRGNSFWRCRGGPRGGSEEHEVLNSVFAMRPAGDPLHMRPLLLLLPGPGKHPPLHGRQVLLPGLP